MLILHRRPGQSIIVGEEVYITLLSYFHGGVRLGIDAPPEIRIVREELRNKNKKTENYHDYHDITKTYSI